MKHFLKILVFVLSIYSCTDGMDKSNRYTFTGETINDYLENREATYSSMVQILRQAKFMGTLSTYGSYTFFLPTNEAIGRYLFTQDSIYHATKDTDKPVNTGITSPYLYDLSDSMAMVISRTHLIPNKYEMAEMSEGVIETKNFNDRYLGVSYKVVGDNYFLMINSQAPIVIGDELVENGVIHVVGEAVSPSTNMIGQQIGNYDYFSLFFKALRETGFEDSLQLYKDESYNSGYELINGIPAEGVSGYPSYKYFKYTGFIETDAVFAENNINSLEDLIAFAQKWYGMEDANNFKSPKNALYKFIAYHFVDREMPYNRLIVFELKNSAYNSETNFTTGADRYDYYEMMSGKMIKVIKPMSNIEKSSDIWMNYTKRETPFNPELRRHLNIRIIGVTEFQSISEEYAGFMPNAQNGVIHPIDRILVYNEDEMKGNVLNERMRFDFSSLMSELTNNSIRYTARGDAGFHKKNVVYIPENYCKNYKIYSTGGHLHYLCANGGWINYMGDEFICIGQYDFGYRIPAVPVGTYELRFGFSANYLRGVAQFYIDGKVTGIPVDLRMSTDNPRIGYVSDALTDDDGVENDKQMRNRGYMKGPVTLQSGSSISRHRADGVRKIITTQYLGSPGKHWIRFKNVLDGDDGTSQFMHDYLEIVPTGVITNIAEPEDRL